MSNDFSYIPSHARAGLEDLPDSLFRDADNLRSLVEAFGYASQSIEDDVYDMLVSSSLSEAKGQVLEQWGALVGEPRLGLEDDDSYRVFIYGRILVNLTEGTTDELIKLYEVLTAPSVVHHWDVEPATAHFNAYRGSPLGAGRRRRIRRQMNQASPAGVDLLLTESGLDALDEGTLQPGGFARQI